MRPAVHLLAVLSCAAAPAALADDASLDADTEPLAVVLPLPIACPAGQAPVEAVHRPPHDPEGPFARHDKPLTTASCADGQGRRRGPAFGFYASGERAFVREPAKKNGLESLRTFHPNGALASEGLVRADARPTRGASVGRWRYWSPDGALERQGAMRKGIPVGRWTTFHPNGVKATEGAYDRRGFRAGTWTAWYPTGKRRWTMNVRVAGAGLKLRDRSSGTFYAWDGDVLFRFREGRLVCRAALVGRSLSLSVGEGVTLASFCAPRSGALATPATRAPLLVLHDGFENVLAVERAGEPGVRTRWAWHDNGQPRALLSLVDGREQGLARGWDRSGARKIELTFEAGRPSGTPVCSDSAGALVPCDEELRASLR